MSQLDLLPAANTDAVLRKLAEDISAFVRGSAVSLLAWDERTGSYHGLSGGEHGDTLPISSLDPTDPVRMTLFARKEPWDGSAGSGEGTGSSGRTSKSVIFPIMVGGRVDYVLAISEESLSDCDVRLISGYCRQAALVIETLDVHATLKRMIDRLSSLVGVVADLSEEQNYRNLLQAVVNRSAELLLAEQGSLMLIEKETDVLSLKASKGVLGDPNQPIRVPKGVGIAGRVAERGEPLLVADVEHDPRIGKKNQSQYKTASFVSVPLKIGSRIVGVMNFTDKTTGGLFDDVDLGLAQACASHVAVVLDRKEMWDETEKLKQQATTDELTGLLNRGCVLNRLREELSRSERYAKVMSLAMLDIDGFKNVNDQYGHAAGDRVLQRISAVMLRSMRSIDIVGRYGGDEFVIILPETDAFFAVHMAQRIRLDIANTDLSKEIGGQDVKHITVSIGIATYPLHGTRSEVLLDHADEALYRAKTNGKDQVAVY